MIRQNELRSIAIDQQAVALSEEIPAISAYLAAKAASKKRLDQIRERIKKGESVETGVLTIRETRTKAVSWEGFWLSLCAVPGVMGFLSRKPAAAEMLAQVAHKDTDAAFVSERLSIEIVEAEP